VSSISGIAGNVGRVCGQSLIGSCEAAVSERKLSSAPSMLPMFARAGAAMIPGASRLPFVGGGGEIGDQALTWPISRSTGSGSRLCPSLRVRSR